jgi:hypothetical protein
MEFSFYHPFATPNFFAALVMFLWIPFVFWVFKNFPARRAIVIAFVVGALYLPEVQLEIPGFHDYTKIFRESNSLDLVGWIFLLSSGLYVPFCLP